MDTPVSSPRQIRLDATNRLDEGISCLKCGYNLRGLSIEGLCPECGTPVGRSVHGDLLRLCSPDWVETLASGMNWIGASIVLLILLGCGTELVTSIMGKRAATVILVELVTAVVSAIGCWKVTTPDPSRLEQETTLTARKLVRIALVLSLLFNTPQRLLPIPFPILGTIMSILGGLSSVVITYAAFIYARQLAMRIPDLSLAKHTRIAMWGLVVAVVAGFAALVSLPATLTYAFPLASSSGATIAGWPTPGLRAGLLLSTCVLGVGALVFGIWVLILLLRYRRQLVAAARQARATWARDPAVPKRKRFQEV